MMSLSRLKILFLSYLSERKPDLGSGYPGMHAYQSCRTPYSGAESQFTVSD